ncbi:MAG: M13 family metallopeptidase [Pyrinomonadaceae bacterium]
MFRPNKRFAGSVMVGFLLFALALAQTAGPRTGFDKANLDTTCKACDDFNQFANGGWLKANPIPPAFSRWGNSSILAQRNLEVAHSLLEADAVDKSAAHGSNARKIGDLYASCMDTAAIEAAGTKPIQGQLAAVDKIKDTKDLQRVLAELHRDGVGAMFFFGTLPDAKNTHSNIAVAFQGGLSLPERDYYLAEGMKEKRAEYVKHVTRMFELLGDDNATASANAATVLTVETKLAQGSMDRISLRDPKMTYNKRALVELNELNINFSWPQYFKDAGRPDIKEVNVATVDFFKTLDREFTATSIADWKTYLRWQVLSDAAAFLPAKFDDENFNFFSKYLVGTKEQLPRWRRCTTLVDGAMGEALGQEYVKKDVSPELITRMRQMINNMIAALREDIGTLEWMTDVTKKQAIEKLEAFLPKVGYPDKWRDYSKLKIDRGSVVENLARVSQFNRERTMSDIGTPVDRMRWGMSVPTVNASYSPLANAITFPAGILRPPFFDINADDAVNYGGIGGVIGHEMSHGFDDQGRQYDAKGLLRDWWTKVDADNYNERANCVAEQFDGFEVRPGLNQIGKTVLGESIGDLGGLKIAYLAYKKSLNGKPAPVIDGFTGDQRFFLGWAQVWATNARPEFEEQQVRTDPHPLARFRVNGPLSNMPEFAAAFSCQAGTKMVRQNRCTIW